MSRVVDHSFVNNALTDTAALFSRFLDRNKLVFNICSNKSNAFDRPTLDLFFEVSRAAYHGRSCPDMSLDSSSNPDYWKQLFEKFGAIHREIQDASRSINKSFGM
jgi:hypothetical protein